MVLEHAIRAPLLVDCECFHGVFLLFLGELCLFFGDELVRVRRCRQVERLVVGEATLEMQPTVDTEGLARRIGEVAPGAHLLGGLALALGGVVAATEATAVGRNLHGTCVWV